MSQLRVGESGLGKPLRLRTHQNCRFPRNFQSEQFRYFGCSLDQCNVSVRFVRVST
jgi:hypothetical protein